MYMHLFVDCVSSSTTGFSNKQKEFEEKTSTPEFKGTVSLFCNTYLYTVHVCPEACYKVFQTVIERKKYLSKESILQWPYGGCKFSEIKI